MLTGLGGDTRVPVAPEQPGVINSACARQTEQQRADLSAGERVRELEGLLRTAREAFTAAMDDDFNTANALVAIDVLVRRINGYAFALERGRCPVGRVGGATDGIGTAGGTDEDAGHRAESAGSG